MQLEFDKENQQQHPDILNLCQSSYLVPCDCIKQS